MKLLFVLCFTQAVSSLPLAPQRKRKNDHQWLMAVAEPTPKEASHSGGNTKLARVWVLFTFRETSFIMSYRNDPWKHSLKLLFSVQTFWLIEVRRFFNFMWGKSSIHPMETILQILISDTGASDLSFLSCDAGQLQCHSFQLTTHNPQG